jgi:hypothetical protein
VANLLSTATSVNNAVKAAGSINVTGKSLANAGVNAALSAATAISSGQNPLAAAANSAIGSIPGASSIASAANSVLGLAGSPLAGAIGGLYGTKPKALHTEYASGPANQTKPYASGEDITFYLVRADDGAGEDDLASDLAGNLLGSVADAVVPADITAGLGLPDGMSSALNQVASASSIAGAVGSLASSVPSLAGPMTGLTEGLSMATNIATSATAALTNPSLSNVTAALGATSAVAGNLSNTIESSVAASESFFSTTLDNAFNAGGVVEGLAKVPTSEFSTLLASTTRGVTSTTDFIAGINDGSLGFTSTSSAAEAARTGPQGTPKKKS